MLSVRDGDAGNLGVLFERHHRNLFNFFLRLTGIRTVAEDLVQEVFFRILKYRLAYRETSQFLPWMYQIARHVRFDHLKKKRDEVPLEGEQERMSGGEMPGAELESREEAALLRRALDRLSPEKREVLVLSRFQHLRYEEIGRLLGCEVGAVKVRVFRAV